MTPHGPSDFDWNPRAQPGRALISDEKSEAQEEEEARSASDRELALGLWLDGGLDAPLYRALPEPPMTAHEASHPGMTSRGAGKEGESAIRSGVSTAARWRAEPQSPHATAERQVGGEDQPWVLPPVPMSLSP